MPKKSKKSINECSLDTEECQEQIDDFDAEEEEEEEEQKGQEKPIENNSILLKKTEDVLYDCGLCKASVKLVTKETIMCKECGYRILFKQRINKYVEYLAR